jgi:tRNA nucleotidyltransferase (CCA-adding enzyme)
MSQLISEEIDEILRKTPELDRAFLVGGCVRDWLLGLPVKDYDVEVFGVTYRTLAAVLARWGKVDLVGQSFGVIKLTTAAGSTYDFSIPRKDSKIGAGHQGFEITFDPGITPQEAAARRDFTINSLSFDPRKREILNFFGGEEDLKNRVLRHTSPAFTEDPLRVLRGMQFAARLDLTPAPETVALCRTIRDTYRELALERVREEWFKWAEKSRHPSRGLRFLVDTGWSEHFPEVHALLGVPQEPEWHPEGDVFVHTCHCLDALVELPEWQAADRISRIVYSLAVLAHDFAKPQTTHRAVKNGVERIVSPGHEEGGGPLAEAFLARINAPNEIRERVVPLVQNHLAHLNQVTDRSVRRLARKLVPETVRGLCIVMTADHHGRPPLPRQTPPGVTELRQKADELNLALAAPKPVLLGRHLLAIGMTPGPQMGGLLSEAFEAQLDGHFHDLAGAYEWLGQQTSVTLQPPQHEALRAQIESQRRKVPPDPAQ